MHTATTRGDTNVASAATPAQYRTPTLCPEHLTPLTPLTNSGVHRVSILLMLGLEVVYYNGGTLNLDVGFHYTLSIIS